MKKILPYLFVAVMATQALATGVTYRYSDSVTTVRGDAVGGASVYVYTANTTTKIALYSGPYTVFPVVSNPITTDGYGRFTFFAEPGIYDLKIVGSNITTHTVEDVRIFADPWAEYVSGKGILQLGLTTEPDTIGRIGEFWFDAADSTLKFYNGTEWKSLW